MRRGVWHVGREGCGVLPVMEAFYFWHPLNAYGARSCHMEPLNGMYSKEIMSLLTVYKLID